ncbi:hypothetical protein GDO86_012744 [Hymenochirus boettgeri]|uniref:Uncharacterized protein n=1 Tax=Hymenochirus boettgeri TaxID=247094 RepID=A0A8T2ITU3_9PIPI|nr:hypothetical protein GDO86_012744 [Hymenochirus boettgeri]
MHVYCASVYAVAHTTSPSMHNAWGNAKKIPVCFALAAVNFVQERPKISLGHGSVPIGQLKHTQGDSIETIERCLIETRTYATGIKLISYKQDVPQKRNVCCGVPQCTNALVKLRPIFSFDQNGFNTKFNVKITN